MLKIIYNAITGETSETPLTLEEMAEIELAEEVEIQPTLDERVENTETSIVTLEETIDAL